MSIAIATELEQRIAASINAERSAEGLSPLKLEAHLNASAQAHSEWMAETGNLYHTGENGSSATDRIEQAEFPLAGSWQTAENLAYVSLTGELGAGEADQMHDGLMSSASHRANILDPDVSYLGIGLSLGTVSVGGLDLDAVFQTQNFAATDGQVLVQEEIDGETVLQSYLDGEPVGEPQAVDSPDDDPDDQDDQDPEDRDDDESGSGGGCFVATAVYGSRSHPDVVALRRFRDEVLVRHGAGRAFIRAYRVAGPGMARLVSTDGATGRAARALISPLARLARERTDRRG
jgi:hypothetical protein